MKNNELELTEESIATLGVTWDAQSKKYQFVLCSKNAGRVNLLLFNNRDVVHPAQEIVLEFPMNKTSWYWHVCLSAEKVGEARFYAYRVFPTSALVPGSRFDSNKILFDPYAKGLFFPADFDRRAACEPGSNAGKAPLGVLPSRDDLKPLLHPKGPRHGHDLIIYELHVRGFTFHPSSGVSTSRRGTFSGLVDKIPYLQKLGITAVELMPVHQFDPKEGNYFGYMTLSFFSPHIQYGVKPEAESVIQEFKDMVDSFHAAGIEVFLDVVYNHTTETGPDGPTYSYRGIDNETYYVLIPPDYTQYENFSACGNDMRTANPIVRRLVMDSLRFWAGEMGIDGFRFDLASILTRSNNREIDLEDPPLISEISDDPILSNVRLIAEPWQGAFGSGYLIGSKCPGKTWRQWNDHFRNEVRGFVKGDPGLVPALMIRLYGSTDLFPDDLLNAFKPYQSVNYIDSHDGLCLYDLVAYTNKDQNSWDCGYPGDNEVPVNVLKLRRQQIKNFCCLLMLSNGTPMFCAGDEFLRTQGGNDNAWDQDNETSWVDWRLLDKNSDIFRFFQSMIDLRKSNRAIARKDGWREHVRWYGSAHNVDFSSGSRCLAYFLEGRDLGSSDLYVMINSYPEPINFTINEGTQWRRIVDTSLDRGEDIISADRATLLVSNEYLVKGRSIVVLSN
jgi:isoamylase